MSAVAEEIQLSDDGLCFTRCLLAWNPSFDVIYFLEKPHKWEPEYALWRANGRPTDELAPGFDHLCQLWDEL